MPKLAVGGEHQDHLVRPMLQVNHIVQGFPAVNSLFFTFRPGEISVEINHDPGITDVRVHPHAVIRASPATGVHFLEVFLQTTTLCTSF